MIMKFLYISVITVSVLAQSCGSGNDRNGQKTDINSKAFQDKLVEANQKSVKRESDEIDQYVKHKGWNMITTGTGLRYMITEHGNGPAPLPKQRVKVNFKVSLMDGTICYSSDSTGAYEFVVNMSSVETGLHEGIQYMHQGDKALMILPSHLAYGLMGDQNRIPPRASVVYELELLSVL